MTSALRRRWFLLLVVAGVGMAWLFPQGLRFWTIYLDPRLMVAVALFLMAWGLESRHLYKAMLRPLPALWATFISYAVVPALAWSAGWSLPDADLRVGLMISASVPCTLASAILWTRLGGGNEAVALLTVLLTTATSWLLTTAWVTFGTGTEVVLDTGEMMWSLALVLVLPVAVGQSSRAISPVARAVTRWRQPLGVLSQLLILGIILKAAVGVRDRLAERSTAIPLSWLVATAILSVGTHLAALYGGFWSSRVLRFDRPSQVAVAFACSQKTLPVALFLFEGYFKDLYPLAVLPMVFYHVGQLVVDTFIADAFAGRRSSKKKEDCISERQS